MRMNNLISTNRSSLIMVIYPYHTIIGHIYYLRFTIIFFYFIMCIYNWWWRRVLFYSGVFSRLDNFKDGNGLIWLNGWDTLFLIKSWIWWHESIPLLRENKISSMFIIVSDSNHPNSIVRLGQCNNHRGDF